MAYKIVNYNIVESILQNNTDLQDVYGDGSTTLKRYNIINMANIIYNLYNSSNINIIEIGIAHGDTAKMLVDEFNNSNFYFFDTFEGLPMPHSKDCKSNNIIGFYQFSLEYVQNIVGVKDNIKYIKGLVEDTLLKNLPIEKIHFVHIDVDLYQPTFFVLDNIIEKMARPSVIIIDDYGKGPNNIYNWEGVKTACDEIEEKYKIKFNLLNKNTMFTQAILFLN